MSSKRYTGESKIEAVKQVVERDYSVAEVAGRVSPAAESQLKSRRKMIREFAEHSPIQDLSIPYRSLSEIEPPLAGQATGNLGYLIAALGGSGGCGYNLTCK